MDIRAAVADIHDAVGNYCEVGGDLIEHGKGVIARVPFDEGSLTGAITPETTFPDGDFRNHYFGGDRKLQVFERIQRLRKLLDGEAKTLPELALRFCLSHEAVSTVIPAHELAPPAVRHASAGQVS